MSPKRVFGSCLMAVIAAAALQTASASVTVTTTTTYQTMEGIGAADGMPTLYQKAGIFFVNRPLSYEYDRFCKDLGASGVRFFIAGEGPFPSAGTYDWLSLHDMIVSMKAYLARGTNRFHITILNPPGWMKTNGSSVNGGNLLDAQYDPFSICIADMCKMFKDSTAVDPYTVCVQNEPNFAEPYGSCIYSDANFSRLTTLTAQRLSARGLTTKMAGPEDVFSNQGLNWPTTRGNADLYAYAGHGNCSWSSAWSYANAGGKKLWMTEWDIGPGMGSSLSGTDPMPSATPIMDALANNLSWWTYFGYSNNLGDGKAAADSIDTIWVPDKRYYSVKMFARFIRPGAVRVGCSVSDGGVSAVAFKNPDNSIAVVMINSSGGTVSENITGSGMPATWYVYQTSSSQNCAYIGTSNGSGISLPNNTITSVTSAGQIPTVPADTIPYRLAAATPDLTVGLLNVKGDDSLFVWINGVQIGNLDYGTVKRMVSIKQGQNIIACYIRNTAWGGGLLGSMMLPLGDTLHTDGTWKVTYKDPTTAGNWNQIGFDDTKWGFAKDVGPANLWPGFERWGSSAVNMYYEGAHWILGATHTYFRKNITFSAAYNGIYIRGNNFNFKMYLDGNQVLQGNQFATCTGGCFTVPAAVYSTALASGSTHCIAFDITDASTDGNGVLMKAGCQRQGAPMPMDTTWMCSDSAVTGWNTQAFNDAAWSHPNNIDAYDPAAGSGNWIYPGRFWFRKLFSSQQATEIALRNLGKLINRNQIVSVKYFTVDGREFKGNLRALALTKIMLIQRSVYSSGKIEDARIMRLR